MSPGPDSGTSAPFPGAALTALQVEVALAFFNLPSAEGFLLAGGAALAAHGMTTRATRDLDLFTSPGRGDVGRARDELQVLARSRGWTVRRIRDSETFVRMVVTVGHESVLVDLALDATPARPGTMSIAGPTLDPVDLAGRKVIALFDRAEARDFADVYVLAARYGQERLLELAGTVDAGFDRVIFADMLDSLARFDDDEIPVPHAEAPALRAFFSQWSRHLRPAGPADDD